MKKLFICYFLLIATVFANDDFTMDFNSEFEENKVEVYDPLKPYNETMTQFNDAVFTYVFNPVSTGYAAVVPEPARIGVSNVFDNLLFPVRFVNNLLQLKIEDSLVEVGRFVVNSTVGILGIWDPASKYFDWDKQDEDFGQTLGHYGVGPGFHIVLPFLGPSNLRDTFGLVANSYLSPISDTSALNYKIPETTVETIMLGSYEKVNSTSLNLGKYENLKKDAIELYPFLRDIYEQRRNSQIKD